MLPVSGDHDRQTKVQFIVSSVNGLRRSELPAIKSSQGFTSNAFHKTKTLTSSDFLKCERCFLQGINAKIKEP